MRLSLPVRIVALSGLVLATTVGAVGSFVLARGKVALRPVSPTAHRARHVVGSLRAGTRSSQPRVDASLPAPLRAALARSAVVVAVLDAPGIRGDGGAVTAARRGAHAARAGFAVLNVRDEAIASALAATAPNATDPAVLVVRRPGTVAVELDGYADSETVAQAAVDARK